MKTRIYIISILLVTLSYSYLKANNIIFNPKIESNKADSLKLAGDYLKSLDIYFTVLAYDVKHGNTLEQCYDYNNIANVYCRLAHYEKSTNFYFKALKLAEKIGNKNTIATIHYNIAWNYWTMRKFKEATTYINYAIETFKNEKSKRVELGKYYCLSASIFTETDHNKALLMYKKAADIFNICNEKEGLANVFVNISDIETTQRNFVKANELARKALVIYKEINDKIGVAVAYINLQVAHHYEHEKTDAPGFKKAMQECVTLLDSGLIAINGIESPEHFLRIYGNKAQLYQYMGNADSAYYYLQKYNAIKDTIYSITSQQQIEELRLRYETEKKEQNILMLEKDKTVLATESEKRKLWIIIGFTGVGFLAVVFLLFVLRSKNRKKQKQIEFEKSNLEFEQKALRAQMNPHFIFNAINSIQSYILNKNQHEAYDYLAKFSKLIRIVLNNSQEKILSLKSELEMMKLYVEMEQLRFNNSFEFNLTVTNDVNDEITIPAMLIQPYVENAIWHGLLNLENERKGVLNLRISMNDTLLKIVIEDNGVGRQRAKAYKKEDSHKSVGMKLTEQRLLMINKMQEYEHAKVLVTDLRDGEGKVCGTKVEIFIPVTDAN